ncbi:heme ABC transporter ATP-binding protein [Halorientalis pallida]|uniref:Cobalamin import ATP-binding protein BtuD n=1 Tax=Halorientalis pallida TaxID=2479928 RepID=A0A498KVM4_9EURY|nr:heme ABC transporter ATP-binding protein [Halorientalis pallida]RXK49257.1 heme ABC transporter ATP-binding protein [Halorientalis pallida]
MIDGEGLTVARGGVTVFEDVSLSVDEGEFVALVGPNGAGKTTLLQVINGVLTPESGTVEVDGRPVTDCSARERGRLVATVPQDTHVGFDFSVADIVAMGRTPYHTRFGRTDREADQRSVRRALDRTDTARFADRPVDEVSGGERQRVLLARALAQDTPALVLDEPTASLDVNHQVETLSLVSDLAASGKAAVAAIHDLDLAARFCDRIVLLADGRVLAEGAPDEVLDATSLGAAFDADAAVTTHPTTGTPSVTALGEPRDRDLTVHVVGTGRTAGRVLTRLHDAGATVTVGPLPEGDFAAETARARNLETVTAPPFGTLDSAVRDRVCTLRDEADVLVAADPPAADGIATLLDARLPVVAVDGTSGADAEASGRTPAVRPQQTTRVVSPGDVLGAVVTVAPERELPADD